MHTSSTVTAVFGALLFCACEKPEPLAPTNAPEAAAEPAGAAPSAAEPHRHPEEVHLTQVVPLTTGGENAEAYWSFDGAKLIFQAHEGEGCDRIYVRDARDASAKPQLVSSGKGATTCSYFLPGDKEVIYASTHLGGDACPPKPDQSARATSGRSTTATTSSTPNVDGTNLRQPDRREGLRRRGAPSARRTARSSSPRCATATSSSTGWTRTART